MVVEVNQMENTKKFICLAILVLIVSSLSLISAMEDIRIEKTTPEQIKFGSNLKVDIVIFNDRNSEIKIILEEIVTNADPIDPAEFVLQETPGDLIAARPPYYMWEISIPSNSDKTISYIIKPLNPGLYIVSQTVGYVDDVKIKSNSLKINVICNQNKQCEADKLENYQSCPDDCPSGSQDGICDLVRDGKCDPDCYEEADIDCKCGNSVCENFENEKLCPKDCKLSFLDKIINWIKSLFS